MAWVCGAEPVLARAVTQAYAKALPALRPLHMWPVREPARVWDDLLTVPSAPQLVVVHEAERLTGLALLPHLLADEFDGCYTVFASAEDDFRREDKQLTGPLAALRDSRHGQLVRCCRPADAESTADIVASWWPGAGRNIAAALLAACGDSLTAAWHAADKAVRTGAEPSPAAVAALAVADSGEDFANLLLSGDRRRAVTAARQVGPGEAGEVLAKLAFRLALLPLVREAQQRRERPEDTVRRLRVDAWMLRLLRPVAAGYDPGRVARCRVVLAMAETAWRAGSRDGVLEAVAALW